MGDQKFNSFEYKQLGGACYQLTTLYVVETGIRLGRIVQIDFAVLTPRGRLCLMNGFAYDGDTYGINFKWSRRASAIHDALCRMVSSRLIKKPAMKAINDLYMEICIEDAGWFLPRWWARVRRRALKKYWGC